MRKLVAIAAIAMLAACGGGGGRGSTADTIDPKVTDQLAADAAVLQASDLPEGFASSSSSSSSSSSDDSQASEDAQKCFEAAIGFDPNTFDKDRTAKAKRKFKFGSGRDLVTVDGEVEVYRDAANVAAQIAALGQPDVAECFRQAFVAQFTAIGATVGDLTVTPIKVDGVGEEQSGLLVSGPVTVNGVDIAFAAEFNYTQVGRFALTASVLSLQGTPDHSLAVTAMTAMANRLPT